MRRLYVPQQLLGWDVLEVVIRDRHTGRVLSTEEAPGELQGSIGFLLVFDDRERALAFANGVPVATAEYIREEDK